jgi:hypothetical protein
MPMPKIGRVVAICTRTTQSCSAIPEFFTPGGELLAPVYGWFTAGFDTADLKDARALLDELRWRFSDAPCGGGRKLIMTPKSMAAPARKPSRDETLIKALVRAHRWRRKIKRGQAKSITDLAEQEGVTEDAYVCRPLPLTCLAPDIVRRFRRS